ncbi:unnamed protein product [Cuscuta epithymum]|uniref:DNL-type domain-containing protein n=1 Tax=Cuscuta epithymum TaxID=186058 RepID=A0AAV0ETJ0_9ASTE|nr:unnamed protein product [Cuscuta epithymum]
MTTSRASALHNHNPLTSFPSLPKSPLPIYSFPCHHNLKPPRLSIYNPKWEAKKKLVRMPMVSCLVDEPKNLSESGEMVIDLKHPRRKLLATFTCNSCGAQSQRFINRLAYERGLVYLQCSGCAKYHKLVDNLGLVVEYILGDKVDAGDDSESILDKPGAESS